jgi:phage terminase Nu1 subunit (DNA packaging protein)
MAFIKTEIARPMNRASALDENLPKILDEYRITA